MFHFLSIQNIALLFFSFSVLTYLTPSVFQKLDVPNGLSPTDAEKRGWIVNPMGMEKDLPGWAIPLAVLPAMIIFILIFMEGQITRLPFIALAFPDHLVRVRLTLDLYSNCCHKIFCSLYSLIVNQKLIKGSGYHLDFNLLGLFGIISG